MAQLKGDLANGASNISIDGISIRPGSIREGQLAGSDNPDQIVIGAVTSEKIADGTVGARDLDAALLQRLEALEAKVVASRPRWRRSGPDRS